ncbi:polyphosphate--glucose phosphotransferase [Pseudarthrobacter sp. C4D7]|uniref:polyphosphate--glucose phosphotransferase n=1 Tax=Pseudarthrobacter sp. C4D7 TaxID=2735268 RepID=UPI001585D027|nr:ROK family protein [Pseudarthrobacter sp. C4D7]NUT70326.1 ROK family protein [Pseudarthrobacter sp. C4D7]
MAPVTAAVSTLPRRAFHIGIDVGGTWIKGALIDVANGTPAGAVRRLQTPSCGSVDAVAGTMARLVTELDAGNPGATDHTVGVAIPSIVKQGVARSAANLHSGWIGLDVQSYLQSRLGRPVRVVNDADAAGLAETQYGAGAATRGVVLVLTLGTGIGSALIVDGRLVPNFELGHLEVGGFKAESRASAVVRENEGLDWVEYASRLQRYLSHVEFLFSPDLIIIGGGISACSHEFLPRLSLRSPVIAAGLENSAGVVGAALQATTGRT